MNIIAIETATDVCGVALFQDGKLVDIVEGRVPREHAKKLPLHFLALKNKTQFNLKNIDAIALSIGPGSFTGLRIGLSFAKGVAYSHGLPIIPVPTLHSLARGCENNTSDNLTVLLHSHKKNLFIQHFHWSQAVIKPSDDPGATTFDQLAIKATDNVIHYNCADYLDTSARVEVLPSARWIGELAVKYFNEWKLDDPLELVPDYISPFNLGKVRS